MIEPQFGFWWGDQIVSRVYATNIYDTSDPSVDSAPTTLLTVPERPHSIEKSGITLTTMTFQFQDGDETGGADITSYIVWQAVQGQDFEIIIPDLQQKEFTAQNLVDLETYQYKVQAVNSQGPSPDSEVLSIMHDPLIEPYAPENLVEDPSNTGATQVGLTWQPPTDTKEN
jgi:predicted phage tail protein